MTEAVALPLSNGPDSRKAAVWRKHTGLIVGATLLGVILLSSLFAGFISPQDLLPIFTFQVFVMLIVGGSGNNRGAIVGTIVIWALWTITETILAGILPPVLAKQASTIRVVLVGFILVVMLLYRPQGLIPEERIVSPEARLGGRKD